MAHTRGRYHVQSIEYLIMYMYMIKWSMFVFTDLSQISFTAYILHNMDAFTDI